MKSVPLTTFQRFAGVLNSPREVEFLEFLQTKASELQAGRLFTEDQMETFLNEFGVTKNFYVRLRLRYQNGKYSIR